MSWLDDLRHRLEAEPELTPGRVVEIVQEGWSGERIYVPRQRREPPAVRPTDTPQTIQARHGVSRSTAYSWTRRWRR